MSRSAQLELFHDGVGSPLVVALSGEGLAAGPESVADLFNGVSYSGSDGTLGWSSDWVESGDSGGAGGGDVAVVVDGGAHRLRVANKNRSVTRSVDLSAAGVSAVLSLDVRRDGLDGASDYVALEISDGGGWVELDRFEGPAADSVYVSYSYDVLESCRCRDVDPAGVVVGVG